MHTNKFMLATKCIYHDWRCRLVFYFSPQIVGEDSSSTLCCLEEKSCIYNNLKVIILNIYFESCVSKWIVILKVWKEVVYAAVFLHQLVPIP